MATMAIDDPDTAVSTARQRDDDIETVAGLSPRGDRSKKFRIDPMARGTSCLSVCLLVLASIAPLSALCYAIIMQ
jgi:hypothetical protein